MSLKPMALLFLLLVSCGQASATPDAEHVAEGVVVTRSATFITEGMDGLTFYRHYLVPVREFGPNAVTPPPGFRRTNEGLGFYLGWKEIATWEAEFADDGHCLMSLDEATDIERSFTGLSSPQKEAVREGTMTLMRFTLGCGQVAQDQLFPKSVVRGGAGDAAAPRLRLRSHHIKIDASSNTLDVCVAVELPDGPVATGPKEESSEPQRPF